MAYVYILRSLKDDSFYIGSSKDPSQRLIKHNSAHKGYTGKKQPWKLELALPFNSMTEALIFEKHLKKQKSRANILKIIAEQNSQV